MTTTGSNVDEFDPSCVVSLFVYARSSIFLLLLNFSSAFDII